MECLHIIPAKGLSGYFYLDMTLYKAVKKLKTFSVKMPCINVIEETQTKRVILDLPECSVRLIFDEYFQMLINIEINLIDSTAPRLPMIFQSKMYTNYSEITNSFESSYKELRLSESVVIDQYMGFSVLRSEKSLLKLFIHKNNAIPFQNPSLKAKIYEARILDKIVIRHTSGKIEDLCWSITPEAAIEILGPADYVRYKTTEGSTDYFYIYTEEGLDLLFDGERNSLAKIIMHTNMMEDVLFNEYDRCNFVLYAENGEARSFNRFDEIKRVFSEEPVEVGVRKQPHGFKACEYFRVPGAIFEVLHTGYIASVTLIPRVLNGEEN